MTQKKIKTNHRHQTEKKTMNLKMVFPKKGGVSNPPKKKDSGEVIQSAGEDECLLNEKYEFFKSIGELITNESQKINAGGGSSKQFPCIYKLPEKLHKLKVSAYTPLVVSIGPIHKDDEHLKNMEEHKVSYMYRLLRRTKKNSDEASKYVDAMFRMVATARTCYAVKLQDISNANFAKMMLVDGCFILELLYMSELGEDDVNSYDPILGNTFVLTDVRHDLLLLENQIPFSVLKELFRLTVEKIPNRPEKVCLTLTEFIRRFFDDMMNSDPGIKKKGVVGDDHHHILDLLRKCYLPRPKEDQSNSNDIEAGRGEDPPIPKRTATELDRAGVKFQAGKEEVLDVEFSTFCWFSWLCGPKTLAEIPKSYVYDPDTPSCCLFASLWNLCGRTRFSITPISIYDDTESFLRNLIAFEHCLPRIGCHVASYAFLMDTLIDNENDVELLEKAGVLQNNLGASEDARNFFNNICKEVVLADQFSFFKQLNAADKYCRHYWPRTFASLRRNYFSNPWAIISVIAALVLFALTIVQTVYTIGSSN